MNSRKSSIYSSKNLTDDKEIFKIRNDYKSQIER